MAGGTASPSGGLHRLPRACGSAFGCPVLTATVWETSCQCSEDQRKLQLVFSLMLEPLMMVMMSSHCPLLLQPQDPL